MRFLALLATLLATTPFAFVAPFIGVLIWAWLSFMSPHQLVWGTQLPLVYMVAVATAIGWMISPDPKKLANNPATYWVLAFAVWVTFTSCVGISNWVWGAWNRDIKNIILGVVILGLMTNRVRLQALVWVIVLSLGFFGLKGGLFTLLKGGTSHVLGPPSTMIADNNNLALALVMTWPFIYYLYTTSAVKSVRIGLMVMMGAQLLAVLGTYSRGGMMGLAVVLGYFWWKSKRKILIGIVGAAALVPALYFMPQSWFDRMHSVQTYQDDSSAESRLESWGLAVQIAVDRPFTGGGFEAITSSYVATHYPRRRIILEAHSIWFQILSDQGFVGLFIFLGLGAASWLNGSKLRRAGREHPEFAWASDLGTMGQLSLAGFWASGTFLSMAYYDVYYAVVGLLAAAAATVPSEKRQFATVIERARNELKPAAPAPVSLPRTSG